MTLSLPSKLLIPLLFLSLAWPPRISASDDIELPMLGDTSSAIISPQQEYDLGRAWLAMFRSRVPAFNDTQMQAYVERLLYEIYASSELEDYRLELVLINNPTINAFAVPGGVIGVHTGLFLHAESEDQFASVLAHEFAHLSQRHFARSVDQQKKSSVLTMAGMLAGLVLTATTGSDAGLAAMTIAQGAALQTQLRYSRQHEQEADRIGMETLYKAHRNPEAFAEMFDQMMSTMRYIGSRPPEFLMTHPLTEKRISDTRNRARNYPHRAYPEHLEYHLMRARAQLAVAKTPRQAIELFRDQLNGDTLSPIGARYGLVLALNSAGNYEDARRELATLMEDDPDRLTYRMEEIEIDRNEKLYNAALEKTRQLMVNHPGYYPLQMSLAETFWQATRYSEAAEAFDRLSRERPNDPYIWYQLAESRGLEGNISAVHQARAEYFILTGVYDKARDQLEYAQKLVRHDFRKSAIISQRLRDLAEMREKADKL